jgi:phenylacetate-coenzyme A ligase PaaK-like adenylate-forming protein
VKQLRELAAAAEQKQWTTPPLEYGLIAFAGLSRPLLTEADRDRLWKAFGVPVFVQFRGFLGELLAMECDCHDGLHVRNGAIWENRTEGRSELLLTSLDNLRYPALRLATRIQGLVDEAPCACGLHSPRLRHLQPMGAATAAHNAAAA